MPDTAIPFPLSSAPGERPQESGGRLWNAFWEKMPQGSPSNLRCRRTAGLRPGTIIEDHTNFRGMRQVGSVLLAALEDRLYGITRTGSSYSASNLGALSGSGPITIARNNVSPTPDIVAVSAEGASLLSLSGPPTAYPSPNVGSPNSVCELDGYFLFTYGDGTIRASELNSTTIKSNSYSSADKRPDGLLRGIVLGDLFYACGSKTIQVYRNVGTTPFPLDYVQTIPRGICGTYAIAGAEEGWSNQLVFAADDNNVYLTTGLAVEPVSKPDVSRAIARCADKTALEAGVYMMDGTPFWWLTSPGEWTWELNCQTREWNEKESFGSTLWRVRATAQAFDKWVAGDRDTGEFFEVDPTYYKEGDDPLVWRVRSANIRGSFVVHRAEFDMTAAVGKAAGDDPTETKPRAGISISLNAGYSFGNPVFREIGRQGDANRIVAVNGLGYARKGMMIEIAVSDPVHVALMSAKIPDGKLEARAA